MKHLKIRHDWLNHKWPIFYTFWLIRKKYLSSDGKLCQIYSIDMIWHLLYIIYFPARIYKKGNDVHLCQIVKRLFTLNCFQKPNHQSRHVSMKLNEALNYTKTDLIFHHEKILKLIWDFKGVAHCHFICQTKRSNSS